MLSNSILLGAVILPLLVSAYILRRLKVFSSASLANAPQRPNRLTLLDVFLPIAAALTAPVVVLAATRSITLANDGVDAAAALVIVFFVSRHFTDGRRGLGISSNGMGRALRFGAALYVGVMPWLLICEVVSAILQKKLLNEKERTHPVLKKLEHVHSFQGIFSLVVMICVIAPIAEELFFRGVVQTLIIKTIAWFKGGQPRALLPTVNDRRMGIVIAAAIFASMHLLVASHTWSWLPPLFLLGIALGYAYERTGSLWADITIHAMFNGLAVVLILSGAATPATTRPTPEQFVPKAIPRMPVAPPLPLNHADGKTVIALNFLQP